jgi:O-Antigen ligase
MTEIVLVLVAALFAAALAVGVYNWRWSILGLILYLPISGIAIDAAYGHRVERAVAVTGKDFLFVLPAYAGFAVWAWRRREDIRFRGSPVVLLLALAAIVLAEAFNPAIPKPLMAVIGIKIWLFYLPLLFLGYYLVDTRAQLRLVLTLIALSAVLPALVGIVEALVVYSGHAHAVYRLYGPAARAVSQRFTQFNIGRGLRRIPSTFSSFTQYFLFLSAMVALVYASWRESDDRRRFLSARSLVWALVIAGAFLSGQRGAWVFVPVLVVVILLLDRQIRLAVRVIPVIAALLVAVILLLGASGPDIYREFKRTVRVEVRPVLVESTREAIHRTTIGLGTGVDSVGARYAYPNQLEWQRGIKPVVGTWRENWYVRTYLELGVLGLAVVLALLATLVYRAVRVHRALRDPRLRSVSAAVLGLVIWTLAYDIKAPYIDFDPINVYFWLGLGLLFKLPSLQGETDRSAADVAESSVPAVELAEAKPR